MGGNPLQLIAAPVGAPPASGDALQSLSAVADMAIAQPATASVDVATLQPATSPTAVDVVTSQPAALLEDNRISQPVYAAAEIATSQAGISPATAEIASASAIFAPLQTQFAPAQLPACPAVLDFTSVPRSSVAGQFLDVLLSQNMAVSSNPFGSSLNAGASDQWVPTPERGNRISTPELGNRMSRPAPTQDRLHDAVFARSLARFSLTEEDGLPDDSSAPADIETFLNDCLPMKSDKSFAQAIDALLAAPRHKKE